MIFIDDRGGSEGAKAIVKNLLTPMLAAGLPVEMTRLDSADIAFIGKGPKGTRLDIGIELKRLDASSTDLTQSLRSGRLAGHQLPKMVGNRGAYDYAWLLVEGAWKHDEDGQVVVYQGPRRGWVPIKGRMSANELEKRILTLELCGGLHVRYVQSRRDTIRFIGSLYRWFTDRDIDKHTSHLVVHDVPTIVPISDFRAAVTKFPGVGLKLSQTIENHFRGSLRMAVCAGVDEWAGLVTVTDSGQERKLGIKLATQIVAFCRGGI